MGEKINSSGQLSGDIEQEKTSEERIEDIKKDLFDREMPPEYQSLVDNVRFIENYASYSENLIGYLEHSDVDSLIKSEIKGGIVLDLGCGQSSWVHYFSIRNGAKLYIGVDLMPATFAEEMSEEESTIGDSLSLPGEDKESEERTSIVREEQEPERVADKPEYRYEENALEVREDMLRAISRMKSNSVKLIITSGIEVLSGKKGGEYLTALITEAKRVLTDDGLLLNYESDVSYHKEDMADMDKIDSGVRNIDLRRKRSNKESDK